jgi:hypothetical protein
MALGTAIETKVPRPANSFQTRLSEAVSESLARHGASLKVLPGSILHQPPVSRNIGAARQNPVARTVASAGAVTSGPNANTGTLPTATAAASPFTGTTSGSAAGLASAPSANSTPNSVSTPADLIASLIKQNAPPATPASTWVPSTNAAVFMLDDYNKQGSLSFFVSRVNHENGMRFGEYQNGLQNWVMGGMQGQPPAPPNYETFDMSGFNKWWDNYSANIGYDAQPMSTFVSNTVPDAGYL